MRPCYLYIETLLENVKVHSVRLRTSKQTNSETKPYAEHRGIIFQSTVLCILYHLARGAKVATIRWEKQERAHQYPVAYGLSNLGSTCQHCAQNPPKETKDKLAIS